MIDISHAQARRLIRLALDSTLPDEQWNALQAHTERCDACRADQARWGGFERQLRRTLNAQWSEVGNKLSAQSMSAAVLGMQARRRRKMSLMRRGLVAALGLALVAGVILNRSQAARQQIPVTANLTLAPTPTATPAVPPFQGVVAFAAPRGGSGSGGGGGSGGASGTGGGSAGAKVQDIYLLESGPRGADLTNLTDNPSTNTAPAWSQDGRWLAFISNRNHPDAKTNDIYTLSIAGTRLTRLTQSIAMRWEGPLSWSEDGRWIAAVGHPQAAGGDKPADTPLLYLIAVDGRQPPRLVASGASAPKFSPTHPWLAFVAPGDSGPELYAYDYSMDTEFSLTGNGSWPIVGQPGAQLYVGQGAAPVTAFDWLEDGKTLTFVTRRPGETGPGAAPTLDVREANDLPLDFSTVQYVLFGRADPVSLHLSSRATFTHAIQEVTWSAFGDLLYVPQERSSGCAQPLVAWQDPGDPDPALMLPALCLAGAVQQDNWLPSGMSVDGGNWLVVAAQRAGDAGTGIYALRIPQPGALIRAVGVLRLANLPAGAGPLEVRPEVK